MRGDEGTDCDDKSPLCMDVLPKDLPLAATAFLAGTALGVSTSVGVEEKPSTSFCGTWGYNTGSYDSQGVGVSDRSMGTLGGLLGEGGAGTKSL